MFAAPGQDFPEKYHADSTLQLHSHHFHCSVESGSSWAACGIGAKAGDGGTKGLSSPLPFKNNVMVGLLDLLHCSTSALPNSAPPICLCPIQVHPKAESGMSANQRLFRDFLYLICLLYIISIYNRSNSHYLYKFIKCHPHRKKYCKSQKNIQ